MGNATCVPFRECDSTQFGENADNIGGGGCGANQFCKHKMNSNDPADGLCQCRPSYAYDQQGECYKYVDTGGFNWAILLELIIVVLIIVVIAVFCIWWRRKETMPLNGKMTYDAIHRIADNELADMKTLEDDRENQELI